MSRDESEFAAYLAARWPVLVRELVLLGHAADEARELALETVVRIHPERHRLLKEEDVDVAVHRELVDVRARQLRRTAPPEGEERPRPPLPEPSPGLAEQAERLEEVTAALWAMPDVDRVVVVLRQVAELADDQVADVLDRVVGGEPILGDADVRLALEAVHVDPLHPGDVAERSARRRRRTTVRVLAGLAVLAVVAAGAWVVRGLVDEVGDVTRVDNPLPMAWYADGTLHLEDVTVHVRPVVDLVTVPDGVVLTDDRGDVVMAEDDGTLTTIGTTVPGEGLVVEPDNGWVAWADPGDGDPEVVVHDTRVGEEIGRRSLAASGEGAGEPVGDSGPIAIDDDSVYYAARDRDFIWTPISDEAYSLDGEMVDTADGSRLTKRPDGGFVLQPAPFRSGVLIDGTDGRLTPDGRYAFVTTEANAEEEVEVFDAATGDLLPRMYSPSDAAVGWTYTDDGRFWFVVLHMLQDKQYQDMLQMPSEGDFRIYECLPDRADQCVDRVEVPKNVPEAPVLAR